MIFQDKRTSWLVLSHILIICLSNTLVQYPFVLFGFRTTWGAFTYPLIFILTDLSTRLMGQDIARKTIFVAMFPGMICSYFISNYLRYGELVAANNLALRIAFACFFAYVFGQLLDIYIFQKFRKNYPWWVAPSVSNIFGNVFDTFTFFFLAFYQSSDVFLSAHWLEIATVDLVFKLSISLLTFIPLYGILLQLLSANKRIILPENKELS
ncbi:MAG: 7-cyano-7-deazaguanine/7-aminomethyl-7-deazaguanine transporter [Tatlockia sp.]|nr:7-cyano-7-deazaguanine/7-aminomethyl-7-deazaguanine transporter [Tatlockia sp.]